MTINFFPKNPEFGDAARKIIVTLPNEEWASCAPLWNAITPEDAGATGYAAPTYTVIAVYQSYDDALAGWRAQAQVQV